MSKNTQSTSTPSDLDDLRKRIIKEMEWLVGQEVTCLDRAEDYLRTGDAVRANEERVRFSNYAGQRKAFAWVLNEIARCKLART